MYFHSLCTYFFYFLFFFFFQAEDGIRDHCVTGVQTCALPISADPDVGAGGAVVAAVLADERRVAALGALGAGHDARRAGRRRLEDAHLVLRKIGRASCRERVEMSVGGVGLEKKSIKNVRKGDT